MRKGREGYAELHRTLARRYPELSRRELRRFEDVLLRCLADTIENSLEFGFFQRFFDNTQEISIIELREFIDGQSQ